MTQEPQQPPSPSPRRRRGLAGALAAFMEARNIFWGELVGAVLIVGCSIALVITLWDTLADNPLFKFATFVGANALVTGAGLYTLSKWKLESASRGLLLIALVLAPLAMLAMLVPPGVGGRLELPVQVVSLLALALLVRAASGVLAPGGAWAVTGAVAGTLMAQMLAVRLVDERASETTVLLIGLLAVACHGLGLGAYLRGVGRQAMEATQANSVFLSLGVATFALAVPLGLLLYYQAAPLPEALGFMAVLLALAGLPILAGGLAVHRGLQDQPRAAGRRAAGTAVALAGMVTMLLAVALAWPRPGPVLAVCTLNFAALTVVGFRSRLPIAHAAALGCLTVAYLMGFYRLAGGLTGHEGRLAERLVELANSAQTGTALAALFVLFGVVGEVLARLGHTRHGKVYALAAVVVAALSLTLVTVHGAREPARPVAVYALYGAGLLVSNLRWRRAEWTYAGLGLLGVASLWALWWRHGQVVPEWGTVLALEALALTMLAAWWPRAWQGEPTEGTETASRGREPPGFPPDSLPPHVDAYRRPLGVAGQVAACVALGLAGWSLLSVWLGGGTSTWAAAHVLTAAALAVLWAVATAVERQPVYARLSSWLTLAAGAVPETLSATAALGEEPRWALPPRGER
ncbi:MAG: hypothetical protein L0Z62_23750, partial [Gemmataceae bacterium]|nr:hypothetical protein [Gemmataceae bacterium]